jgi:hypothetical protein
MKDDVIEVRSDVNNFPTVGEAIDEALLRTDGWGFVFVHSSDDSQPHTLDDGENCFCNPVKMEAGRLR